MLFLRKKSKMVRFGMANPISLMRIPVFLYIAGVLIFAVLYILARWATQTDPQILRFLLTAATLRSQYDPMKFAPISVRRDHHAKA